jgi:cytochrome c553
MQHLEFKKTALLMKTATMFDPFCFPHANKTNSREDAIMKTTKIAMLVLTIAVALFILIPNLAWAEDGAALYKAKCAMCHGPDGAGKPAVKAPSLISDEAKKKTDEELTKVVETNPKHAALAKALTADQVKAIVAAVRDLQKK